jgi:hypothetical protein
LKDAMIARKNPARHSEAKAGRSESTSGRGIGCSLIAETMDVCQSAHVPMRSNIRACIPEKDDGSVISAVNAC